MKKEAIKLEKNKEKQRKKEQKLFEIMSDYLPNTVTEIKNLINGGLFSDPVDINCQDDGLSFLHTICHDQMGHLPTLYKKEQIDLLQFAVKKNVKINIKDSHGRTPLLWLLQHANTSEPAELEHILKVLQILIDAGADVNAIDENGYNSLFYAICGFKGSDRAKIFDFLLTKGANILTKGANINAKTVNNPVGVSLLHYAVCFNDQHIVGLCIQKGLDINAKNNEGYTALHYAAESGHNHFIKFFMQKGLDINAQANNGATTLHIAMLCSQPYPETVRFLLNNGANPLLKINRDAEIYANLSPRELAKTLLLDPEKKEYSNSYYLIIEIIDKYQAEFLTSLENNGIKMTVNPENIKNNAKNTEDEKNDMYFLKNIAMKNAEHLEETKKNTNNSTTSNYNNSYNWLDEQQRRVMDQQYQQYQQQQHQQQQNYLNSQREYNNFQKRHGF